MAVIVFFSAKGAPGVTTTAMLTASLWPRPAVLIDCDPAGGDIGLRLPGIDGRPLDRDRGLLSVLPLARRAMAPEALMEHAQQVVGGGEVILGLSGPEQAAVVGPLWTSLAQTFAGLRDRDVIIDAGRVDSRSPHLPVLQNATIAVCVMRSDVAGTVAARFRLKTLLPSLSAANGVGPLLGVVVQDGNEARDVAGVVSIVRAEVPDIAYFGPIATDRKGAEMFEGRPVSRPERTLLVRSGVAVVSALVQMLTPVTAAAGPSEATWTPPEPRAGHREAKALKAPKPPKGGRRRAADRSDSTTLPGGTA